MLIFIAQVVDSIAKHLLHIFPRRGGLIRRPPNETLHLPRKRGARANMGAGMSSI